MSGASQLSVLQFQYPVPSTQYLGTLLADDSIQPEAVIRWLTLKAKSRLGAGVRSWQFMAAEAESDHARPNREDVSSALKTGQSGYATYVSSEQCSNVVE